MLTCNCFIRSTTNVITTNTSYLEKLVIATNGIPQLQTVNVSINTIKMEVEEQIMETVKKTLISTGCQTVFFFWKLTVYRS